MLSILIPVYNYSVTELVNNLHVQCTKERIEFEILLLDDASSLAHTTQENESLAKLNSVHYSVNSSNLGNAQTRIKLAKKARFPWLLFLDADVALASPNFIRTYLKSIAEKKYNLIGGSILYKKDSSPAFRLKLKHGNATEVIKTKKTFDPLALRGANFMVHDSVNFASLFVSMPHNYGYTDTVFALNLQQKKIPFIVINNPVYHLGIEGVSSFITKTKQAVENAFFLNKNYPNLAQHILLIKYYRKINRWGLVSFFGWFFTKSRTLLEKNLYSRFPKLFILQIYKLGYLCAFAKTDKSRSSSFSHTKS